MPLSRILLLVTQSWVLPYFLGYSMLETSYLLSILSGVQELDLDLIPRAHIIGEWKRHSWAPHLENSCIDARS
jgi:hypothetical protein